MNANTIETTDGGTTTTQEKRLAQTRRQHNASTDFDQIAFCKYIQKLKGTKTIKEMEEETDLSYSFISKALTGNLESRPRVSTLLKLLRVKTNKPVKWRDLAQAAGYKSLDYIEDPSVEIENTQNIHHISATTAINKYYGENPFVAMSEFLRALSKHGVEGDLICHYFRAAGYFEVIDGLSGQVYVGINAYLKPTKHVENESETQSDLDDKGALYIGFSVGCTYNKVMASKGAEDKIVYILTDNEKIFDGCQGSLPLNKTKATIILLTENHECFSREVVLFGDAKSIISLVD